MVLRSFIKTVLWLLWLIEPTPHTNLITLKPEEIANSVEVISAPESQNQTKLDNNIVTANPLLSSRRRLIIYVCDELMKELSSLSIQYVNIGS